MLNTKQRIAVIVPVKMPPRVYETLVSFSFSVGSGQSLDAGLVYQTPAVLAGMRPAHLLGVPEGWKTAVRGNGLTVLAMKGFKRVIDEQEWIISRVVHSLNENSFMTGLEL